LVNWWIGGLVNWLIGGLVDWWIGNWWIGGLVTGNWWYTVPSNSFDDAHVGASNEFDGTVYHQLIN
jgi:hypothetical protein